MARQMRIAGEIINLPDLPKPRKARTSKIEGSKTEQVAVVEQPQ